jgi:hypothetical protein
MGDFNPGNGAVVLHCGHLQSNSWHWFGFSEPIEFTRPDGSSGTAQWQIACERCFLAAEGDVQRLPIRGDAVWMGAAPIEVRDKN